MAHLIDKDALVAEIKKREKIHFNDYHINKNGGPADYGACNALHQLLSFIDALEVKEVDLEKELDSMITPELKFHKALPSLFDVAKHFFELGLKASNPTTAADRGMVEEVIINLKRVESDYRIDLTEEIEWVRHQAQKGE